jgi:hypothetical protein
VQFRAGCYVLIDVDADPSEEYVRRWVDHVNGDLRLAEKAINHRHIMNLISILDLDYSKADVQLLALIYQSVVEHRLREKFPDVQFEFIASDGSAFDKSASSFEFTVCRAQVA